MSCIATLKCRRPINIGLIDLDSIVTEEFKKAVMAEDTTLMR